MSSKLREDNIQIPECIRSSETPASDMELVFLKLMNKVMNMQTKLDDLTVKHKKVCNEYRELHDNFEKYKPKYHILVQENSELKETITYIKRAVQDPDDCVYMDVSAEQRLLIQARQAARKKWNADTFDKRVKDTARDTEETGDEPS